MYGFDFVRVFFHPEAAKEEGGLHVIPLERLENEIRFVIFPGRVNGDGNLFVAALHAVNGKLALFPGKHLQLIFLHDCHAARCRGAAVRNGDGDDHSCNDGNNNDGCDHKRAFCDDEYTQSNSLQMMK